MKKTFLPETCIYCQKNLVGDSVEGSVWTCLNCPKTEKSRHASYSYPLAYILDDNYNDRSLEWLCIELKEYCIMLNYLAETTNICKMPNPYHNILMTLSYIPELDLMDREKLESWAKGLHQIVAFS